MRELDVLKRIDFDDQLTIQKRNECPDLPQKRLKSNENKRQYLRKVFYKK